MKQKGFATIIILIIILLFIAIALPLKYCYFDQNPCYVNSAKNLPSINNIATNTPSPGSIENHDIVADSFKNLDAKDQILISTVPNFDNLSWKNLPNFRTVRGVFNYNGYLIVAGPDRIIAYNPKNKKYIWQNNDKVLSSIYYTVVAGDYLYISTDKYPGQIQKWGQKIVKVSLKSGKLIKSLLEDKNSLNITLYSKGKEIWGETMKDGVFKLNPQNDEFEFFSRADALKNPDYLTIFREEQNNLNKQPTEFGIELPYFEIMSSRIITPLNNDKYYLFSKDKIYVLERGMFPVVFNKTNMHDSLNGESKVYITMDQKFALLIYSGIGGFVTENPTIESMLSIVLINMQNGESADLISKSPLKSQTFSDVWEKKFYKINYEPGYKVYEDGRNLILKETDTGNIIFTVNLAEKTVVF